MDVHHPVYGHDRFLRQWENGAYGGAVACIDWAAGVIFHELKAQGMDENTLVIFTSDNGSRAAGEGGSNAPLRGTKRTTWEGGMRLPCIMRWPAEIPMGSVCSQNATSMDLYPTLAALGGAAVPDGREPTFLRFAAASTPNALAVSTAKRSDYAVRSCACRGHSVVGLCTGHCRRGFTRVS